MQYWSRCTWLRGFQYAASEACQPAVCFAARCLGSHGARGKRRKFTLMQRGTCRGGGADCNLNKCISSSYKSGRRLEVSGKSAVHRRGRNSPSVLDAISRRVYMFRKHLFFFGKSLKRKQRGESRGWKQLHLGHAPPPPEITQ